MEDNVFVTKAKMCQGKSYTTPVKTNDGVFEIRQLTVGEAGHARSLLLKGIIAKGTPKSPEIKKVEGSGTDFAANQLDQSCYIIACALTLDKKGADVWKSQDVRNSTLSETTIKTLTDAIEEFSALGIGEAAEQAKKFCKDTGGTKSSNPNNKKQNKSSKKRK